MNNIDRAWIFIGITAIFNCVATRPMGMFFYGVAVVLSLFAVFRYGGNE